MKRKISRYFFDESDYDLLKIVNDVVNRGGNLTHLKNLLYPYLHPRGIKELAAPRGLRIAYAVVHLLESLEVGEVPDRLSALRAVQNEVLHSAESHLHRNTARVLLQIMKELVRSQDKGIRQLQLAHDFRTATSGKPRIIRSLLGRYNLLEMPEEWNQIAFDDHVHDSHTKGRKSPCHLIMDAWIKGIRSLSVIYYNHVRSEAAAELLEAAEIMGISVRIGVEFSARFHDRNIHLIWVPRGFSDAKDFLSFLARPEVKSFMEEGREVSKCHRRYVLSILRKFNDSHRETINEEFGLNLGILNEADFLAFVGSGQASILHLAKFIHLQLFPLMCSKVDDLRDRHLEAPPEKRKEIADLVERLNNLDSEALVEYYLRPVRNPDIPDPHRLCEGPETPPLLNLSPSELLDKIAALHSGYRITLNMSNLTVVDVLELLYDCKGAISYLEVFNLKDYISRNTIDLHEINELQRCINDSNVVALKRLIREIIERIDSDADTGSTIRMQRLREIQCNISMLQSYYANSQLKTCLGSDSTGHSRRFHGMGLAIKETLPRRAQREVERRADSRLLIPVSISAFLRETHIPLNSGIICRLAALFPRLNLFGSSCRRDWVIAEASTRIVDPGNVVSLGGVGVESGNGFSLNPAKFADSEPVISWKYLNSGLKNALKVSIGFVPAFATFALTKDWWLLAYFGAVIWFGITGLRNILQSVLGAGGIRRSPLLGWSSYVNWDRLSDSLLFTGFSVPLLDYVVKGLVLERTFGITAATSPVALYSIMALANGLYISSHNYWRGLPSGAVIGNFFRSVLSIPLAIVLNSLVGAILFQFGIVNTGPILQKWAAIISKTASDCMAGMIEGLTDRYKNIRMRTTDYTAKLKQLVNTYERLELLYPETDVMRMFDHPKQFIRKRNDESSDIGKILIINGLDLLYFWMYQPRGQSVLRSIISRLSEDEKMIFFRSQSVLQYKKEVSQLFVDGILGNKFDRALSLYLNHSGEYLKSIENTASTQSLKGKVLENSVIHLAEEWLNRRLNKYPKIKVDN